MVTGIYPEDGTGLYEKAQRVSAACLLNYDPALRAGAKAATLI